jgi:hypothetical protein
MLSRGSCIDEWRMEQGREESTILLLVVLTAVLALFTVISVCSPENDQISNTNQVWQALFLSWLTKDEALDANYTPMRCAVGQPVLVPG